MKFFEEFERKYRKLAIPNLMYYIIIMYGVGLVIQLSNPMIYWEYLCLDAGAILRGQIWRVVTFLIYPPALGNWIFDSVLLGVLALFVYYNLGQTLEHVWGSFRFTLFFFVGAAAQVIVALIGWLVFHQELIMTTGYLNLSIFLAFAISFPDATFYLFFAIPIKAKWLAVAEAAVCVYSFITTPVMAYRVAMLVALANVIWFFFVTRNYKKYSPKEVRRKQAFKQQVKIMPAGKTRHKCAVCGRTELDGENLEFRFCSKCEGNYEYCQDHLYTHQHVTAGSSGQTDLKQ